MLLYDNYTVYDVCTSECSIAVIASQCQCGQCPFTPLKCETGWHCMNSCILNNVISL